MHICKVCLHVFACVCAMRRRNAGYRQMRAASSRHFLRVKLYTHWSDTCAVNECVVETVTPRHPMPSIQMMSAFTERQVIKLLQERSLPRDAC